VTEAEAQEACARFAAGHPDRETHQWRPRHEADGSWSVVRIALPPAETARTAETRADERPATADDPRTTAVQNLGPNIGPGI
jgi:hypothetical protein